MFVRWKNRTLATRTGSGLNDRSFYAVIVKNQRVEGRTRQKVVKYLAHINESEIDLPEHREYFWQRVDLGLRDLDLSREERAEIEMKLAGVVRRPGEENGFGSPHAAAAGGRYEIGLLQPTGGECPAPLSTT
jgi:hypothetical protein